MGASTIVAAIAYQSLHPVATSTSSPRWLPFVLVGGFVAGLIMGPLLIRTWRRRHVLRTLTEAMHRQALAALRDPLLVHQARRAVSAGRRGGAIRDDRDRPTGPPRTG